jgi:excisionase family DNA binding protein
LVEGRNLDNMPDVLTVEQFRQIMQIGRNQAYEFIHSGAVRSIKLGRIIRIPKLAVKELLGKPAE